MSLAAALPAVLSGLAVTAALAPARAPARLAALLPRAPAAPVAPRRLAPLGPGSACALAGLAFALVVSSPLGVGLGLVLAVGGPRVLLRLEPRAVRAERERLAADLPLALDLLAACLLGGAALPAAVAAVATAVPGPCGSRFGRVHTALEVGSPAAEAWQALREGPTDELADSAVRALVRSVEGGTPVAEAVTRLALEARETARARGEEAAERAGVLAVGPLGLCFLPAFVLLGIVPVVAGLVGPLLAGL